MPSVRGHARWHTVERDGSAAKGGVRPETIAVTSMVHLDRVPKVADQVCDSVIATGAAVLFKKQDHVEEWTGRKRRK